jgi:hypothetical protein
VLRRQRWTAIGRRYWAEAGVDGKSTCAAPATDTLRGLPADTRFDLAFIGADKSSYGTYCEEILARMDPGGDPRRPLRSEVGAGARRRTPADRDTAALIAFQHGGGSLGRPRRLVA